MTKENMLDEDDGQEPVQPTNHAFTAIALVVVLLGFVSIVAIVFTVPDQTQKVALIGIITATIPSVLAGVFGALNSADAARNSRKNTRRILTLGKRVDGQMEELKAAKFAEGQVAGQAEGKAIEVDKAAAVAAAAVPAQVVLVAAPVAAAVVAPPAALPVPPGDGKDSVIVTGDDLSAAGPTKGGKP